MHTADWHIGMSYTGLGERSKEAREKRFHAAENAVKLAKEKKVDFVLIAGDLFDSEHIASGAIRRVVSILNSFVAPVYVIPGNHDPYRKGSVWEHDAWAKLNPNVHLLLKKQSMDIGTVTLFASPLLQKEGNGDPTEWFPKKENGRISIGMAHGSLSIRDNLDFPISRTRCQDCSLDYLALGHWHSHFRDGKAAYSGSIEPTKFGEADSGCVLIVEIPSPGAAPIIEQRKTNALSWVEINRDIQADADVEILATEIKSIPNMSSTVLRVNAVVKGTLGKEALIALQDLRKELAGKTFALVWDNDVDASPALNSVEIPEGILKRLDMALGLLADGHDSNITDLTANKEQAAAARELLHRIAAGEEI